MARERDFGRPNTGKPDRKRDEGFKGGADKPGRRREDGFKQGGNRDGGFSSDSRKEGGFKSGSRPGDRTEGRSGGRSEGRPEGRPAGKSFGKPDGKPAGKSFGRPDGKPAGKPFGRPEERGFGRRGPEGAGRRRDEEFAPGMEKPDFEEVEISEDKLEGRNPILEALKAGRTINKLLIARGDREGSIKQIIAAAREKGIVVQEVDRTRLDALSSTGAHQGVIAFAAIKDYVEIDDILEIAKEKGEQPFIIILDEIADPHNLGSILRTADAVGAHGVVIPKRRAVGLTPAVAKASAGAVEYVPVARVTNIVQTVEYLKKQNIWIVGTDSSGRDAFYSSDLKGAVALVVGSEGQGIGKLILDKCDFIVNIPMKGRISSLNASVAGAVVMYEILKQRGL